MGKLTGIYAAKEDRVKYDIFYSAFIQSSAGENRHAEDFTFPIRTRIIYHPMTVNMGRSMLDLFSTHLNIVLNTEKGEFQSIHVDMSIM